MLISRLSRLFGPGVFGAVMILSGCSTPSVVKEAIETPHQSDAYVLLNTSPWDSKLRAELTKRGFRVLKSPASEARYGLLFSWVEMDKCVENNTKVIDAKIEVKDFHSKEVVLVIRKNGFTGPCGPPRTLVFEDLANLFAVGLQR